MTESYSTKRYGPVYERLREKLRAARADAGLTQAQVGQLVERPQSFISKIEGGERGIDFVEIQVLAQIYKKPRSYFDDDELSTKGAALLFSGPTSVTIEAFHGVVHLE